MAGKGIINIDLISSLEKRIEDAVEIALNYGQIDGNHHKNWVIDQMLRSLLNDEYEEVINEWNSTVSKWDKWDEGTEP